MASMPEKRSVSKRPPEAARAQNTRNNAKSTPPPIKNTTEISKRREGENKPPLASRFSRKIKIAVAFGTIALVFIIFSVINIAIGVREIDVDGVVLCTREEIIETVGITEGSGYFSYNTSKAEKSVKESFPCVEKISVSRSVFGKVSIKVEEIKAHWYVESYGQYFALSDELIVVKCDEIKDRYVNAGLVRIDFPEIKSAVLGKKLEITDGDRDCSYVFELLSDVEKTDLFKSGRLSEIKIKTKFEIFMVVDRKHYVTVGNSNDIGDKLRTLLRTLADARFDGESGWEINVSDIEQPTARENRELDFSYLFPTNSPKT